MHNKLHKPVFSLDALTSSTCKLEPILDARMEILRTSNKLEVIACSLSSESDGARMHCRVASLKSVIFAACAGRIALATVMLGE